MLSVKLLVTVQLKVTVGCNGKCLKKTCEIYTVGTQRQEVSVNAGVHVLSWTWPRVAPRDQKGNLGNDALCTSFF